MQQEHNMHKDTDVDTDKALVEEYISGLSEQERIVMKIAEQHLETSFDIIKSIGYQEWKKTKTEPETPNK
jgi:hypothetical protein